MKKLDFSNHLFRASSSSKLTTGSIGITKDQENEIEALKNERDTGINVNGRKVKWTENKQQRLTKLLNDKNFPEIPKTMETELKKIFRSEKYGRRFLFTNKYIKKGLDQEEESFSVYQEYLLKVKGIKVYLKNNKERINGEFFTGETDSHKSFHDLLGYGFDIKTSWSLETLPFKDEKLDSTYKWQDMVYMHLTGLKKWVTVYVLVNNTENTIHNEKMKYFYQYNMHQSEKNEEQYNEICRQLELDHIVDYDKFVHHYPGHVLTIGRKEWMDNNWDIPLEDRVIEKEVVYNEKNMEFLIERAKISREYLQSLV